MKPGYKTTEFYMALLGAALPVIQQYLLPNLPVTALLTTGGVIISYIVSRTVAKS